MKEELLALAERLGFDLCRVAPAGEPPHTAEFHAWLEGGNAGQMGWLERNKERRSDPQLVLPGAKSVIVLGMGYWAPEPTPTATGATGRIARYAWGDDYHDVIEKKLAEIAVFLARHGGTQKCYVDTGPMLERDFAALAGAGWHGKSTMLISRSLGTWFLLAEILTTLDLAPDAPMEGHCGKCTRCIAACPTKAIVAPHHLDARRCISYLTIELEGSIPEEFRPLIGDRIYGCDACLDACPWNRFASASRETAFAARDYVAGWALADFLDLDDESFRALFRRSPIKRIKRKGFLRNVCVALGNVGSPDDLPALEKAACDPESLISEHARWAIARIHERQAADRVRG